MTIVMNNHQLNSISSLLFVQTMGALAMLGLVSDFKKRAFRLSISLHLKGHDIDRTLILKACEGVEPA